MMDELNINDKVYKFYNGRYEGGVNLIVQSDGDGYGIIPTDCKINGVEPTIENTTVEHFPKSGEKFVVGYGFISIHKATPNLKEKVDKYNSRMFLIDQLCELFNVVGNKDKENVKKLLLTRTTKQLFAILLLLIDKADGKRGICTIKEDGILENDFFIPEELINVVKEPTNN